ncbi:hypothetical protein CAOG_05222 [Capsaspora owczarzaki ATCC 30864]|uniref:hypothetical protein n=1 Tax=Capsaspora owczarzaki (strain ATCC 30864) TaxID=595528 RepID=UPI0001FE45B8|nr:hypothetical protein CAOG_05222 [Capsaspora owczarzaki ATCC 30864]|eukprot:XP_004346907.1 hypothetical protein CAOG_05222 [Capsaspora owczarzaki ATCC 30864]
MVDLTVTPTVAHPVATMESRVPAFIVPGCAGALGRQVSAGCAPKRLGLKATTSAWSMWSVGVDSVFLVKLSLEYTLPFAPELIQNVCDGIALALFTIWNTEAAPNGLPLGQEINQRVNRVVHNIWVSCWPGDLVEWNS